MPRRNRTTTTAQRPSRFQDGHGNNHRDGEAVTGVVIAYPTTGTPLDLFNLRRVRATVEGRVVEANFRGPDPIGSTVRVVPHFINAKVWHFRLEAAQ